MIKNKNNNNLTWVIGRNWNVIYFSLKVNKNKL